MLRYDRLRRRLWIAGCRVHHGAVGVGLVLVGTVLVWHDRRDWPFWRDELRRASSPALEAGHGRFLRGA